MEFLSKRRRRLSWQNIPSAQEREETAVFAGCQKLHLKEIEIKGTAWKNVLELTQMQEGLHLSTMRGKEK